MTALDASTGAPARTDVAILGGGLAGLTLALHLKQQDPGIGVAVIERRGHPVSEAAHKVGESSVEIGAHYFTNVLGELAHFEADELPKLGLRYFFGDGDRRDLASRTELGGNTFFVSRSWQIDRGRFENHLGRRCRERGIRFVDGARVCEVALAEGPEDHVVSWSDARQEPATLRARWVVDASGRAGILKRKLGLAKANGHNANAVWWRYDQRIKIDDWSEDPAWQSTGIGQRKRWLSTVHLMGPGYWVWLIPLASGSHSFGIVADADMHPFSEMSSYEKALEWLRRHEPQCAQMCAGRENQIQDFLGLKGFSYSSKQVYSARRWACTGEAGAFLDPFYSPGSDFIAMGNTFIADLIARDRKGEPIGGRAPFYDSIYFTFFENHLTLYEGQMPLFDNAKVMSAKIIWDFAYYWTVPATFFFHGRQTDLRSFSRARARLDASGVLNRRIQRLFRDWHARAPAMARTFIDIPGIPFMAELNRGLQDRLDDESFSRRLEANLDLLGKLALEIAAIARDDVAPAALEGLLGPGDDVPCDLLAPVADQLRRRPAAASTQGG